jgi:hypothetical protein
MKNVASDAVCAGVGHFCCHLLKPAFCTDAGNFHQVCRLIIGSGSVLMLVTMIHRIEYRTIMSKEDHVGHVEMLAICELYG